MRIVRMAMIAAMVLLPVVVASSAGDKRCVAPSPAQDNKFRPGQVWEYKTRSGEEKSVLTILRIESWPKGIIVHIRVDGVHIKNCLGGPDLETIEHMPFAREAVDRSVTKLIKENSTIPDFQAGYDEWRKACGGVYTIGIADAVKIDEITFTQNLGCAMHP